MPALKSRNRLPSTSSITEPVPPCYVREDHIWSRTSSPVLRSSGSQLEFVRLAKKEGIQPIAGMELHRDKQLLYIGIARNREGFRELNDFLTKNNIEEISLPDRPPHFTNVYIVYPFKGDLTIPLRENEYIGIRYKQLNGIAVKSLEKVKDKLLALCPVTIKDDEEYMLHQYLRAIDLNTLITKVEDEYKCSPDERFLHIDEICRKFEMFPFIISNTEKLMRDCSLIMPEIPPGEKSRNKKHFTENIAGDFELLRNLTYDGMLSRYGNDNEKAKKKIKDELLVIRDQGFAPYFLITHDIISHFMQKGYYHVGRGSGANSTVAYCLRITDVDPIELDLYFERFLNKARTSPPDFDIDLSRCLDWQA